MYQYSAVEWLFIFYVYCVFGWVFETTVVSVQQRRFVNRGFLDGPMLPIYGFGASIMLHVALPLYDRPVALFFAGMVVATAFEYVVGVLMETIFKVKYWDYSTHRFQFQGRICLQSSIAWGVLSLVLPYWLHRPVERLIEWLPHVVLLVITGGVTIWFVWDVIDSTRTALDLARVVQEVDRLRTEADGLREQLRQQAAEARERLEEQAEETRAQLSDLYAETKWRLEESAERARTESDARMARLVESLPESTREQWQRVEENRLQMHLALMNAEDAMRQKITGMRAHNRRTLRGNPTLRSARFQGAVDDIRRILRENKK